MANTLKFGNGQWYGKAGSILAYNDENNNYKPLPFTFTRASSATRVNESGLIESVGSGIPRVDYLNNADGHLLLEPSRTNLVTYSDAFDNAAWSKTGITITANEVISPDGTQNADKLENSSDGARYISQSISLTSGTSYTYSAFFKKGIMDWCYMLAVASTDISASTFDILNGVVGSTSNSTITTTNKIEDYGNGWYKCSITFTAPTTASYAFRLYNADSSTDVNTVAGSYSYIYGAQLEAGSYATSYIPTSGSSVTRVAEDQSSNLNIIPLNIGNSYTLFFDVDLNRLENNKVFLALSNSAGTLSFTIRNNVGGVRLYDNIGASYPVSGILSGTNKFVLRIDGTSYKIFVSGTSLSGSIATARNLGYLGSFLGSNTELKVNEFKLYDTAISDSECQSLVN